jgi:hypothetical protein
VFTTYISVNDYPSIYCLFRIFLFIFYVNVYRFVCIILLPNSVCIWISNIYVSSVFTIKTKRFSLKTDDFYDRTWRCVQIVIAC